MRATLRAAVCVACLPACVEPDSADVPEPDVSVQSSALINHQPPAARGLPQADFDGDGALDLVLVLAKDFQTSAWFVDYSENGFGEYDVRVQSTYGALYTQFVPADYNCDGRADIATVGSDGAWRFDFYEAGHVSGNNGGFAGAWNFEGPSLPGSIGIAVPADYNQDGCADLAIKGDDGVWRIDYYEATDLPFGTFGFAGWDVEAGGYGGRWSYPVPGDYKEGSDSTSNMLDLAIRDDGGAWYINYADETEDDNDDNNYDGGWDVWGMAGYGVGGAGEVVAAADFDGDSKVDLSVRGGDGVWRIDLSRNGYGFYDIWPGGYGGDWNQPLPGDYTNDGHADLAVKDDCGNWYIDWAVPNPTTQWPIYSGWDQAIDWAVPTGSRTVANLTDLIDALDDDFVATITLGGSAFIEVGTTRDLILPACVRLTSDRGGLRPGGMISAGAVTQDEFTTPRPVFRVFNDNVRIDHLRMRGPSASPEPDAPHTMGVQVDGGRNFQFDHNEAFMFPRAAVDVDDFPARITATSGIARITENYFHHNQRDQDGYGVAIGERAWAHIEANLFNWHRHGITHAGAAEGGYFAYRNYFLQGTHAYGWGPFDLIYEQHMDVHGDAYNGHGGIGGERFDIGWNTVRGEQSTEGSDFSTRPALRVRGEPTDHTDFHDNVVVHSASTAVTECWGVPDPGPGGCVDGNIQFWNNHYDIDQSTDLGVGDLDGDGRSDVFVATGNTWWYSSGGMAEWRYLNQGGLSASAFRFADVDGVLDSAGRRRDDVIWAEGTNIVYSSAGTGPATVLTDFRGPTFTEHHFANFYNDGNPRVDIFARDLNGQWHLWNFASGWLPSPIWAATAWNDLRFGEFDATPGADVLARRQVGPVWRYRISSGAVGGWTTINNDYGAINTTVVADFDGNGRSDLAVRNGNNWWWMPGAQGGWFANLRVASDSTYSNIHLARFGQFDDTPGADAIRIEQGWVFPAVWGDLTRFVKWSKSADPSAPFVQWSFQEMR